MTAGFYGMLGKTGGHRPPLQSESLESVVAGGLPLCLRVFVVQNASVFFLLLLLLAASGCAALIYEIVWLQLLQLTIGSSAVSLGLLLAAYMGGLSLGSAAVPRLIAARRHPLRVYACLEFGIAAFRLVILHGLPLIGRIYNAGAMSGMAGLVGRGILAAACLVPPTLLMGASFPAIARWVEMTAKPISWLGALYTANIAGAIVGCVV